VAVSEDKSFLKKEAENKLNTRVYVKRYNEHEPEM
jgi:hypothetical protein